jgi:hypothetical protein
MVAHTVLPDPVASDMPSLLWPFARYASTDWMHSSWYSRSVMLSGATGGGFCMAGATSAGVDAYLAATLTVAARAGRLTKPSAYLDMRNIKR